MRSSFYSHALRGSNVGMCKERGREVMARSSGRESVHSCSAEVQR
jgi:hypothetical protein